MPSSHKDDETLEEIHESKKVLEACISQDSIDVPTESEITEALEKLDGIKDRITKTIMASTKIGVVLNKIRLSKPSEDIDTSSDSTTNVKTTAPVNDEHRKEAVKLIAFLKKKIDDDRKKGGAVKKSEALKAIPYLGPEQQNAKRMRTIMTLLHAYETGLTTAESRKEYDAASLGKVLHDIEHEVHHHFFGVKSDVSGYIDLLKALKANISDTKNPDFRKKLYVGAIPAEEVATLTSADMASAEKQKARDAQRKDALEACQSDWDLRNIQREEGQFPCGKCKSRKTTYFQMQTRSSDEPMTTYVTCNNCGNRWKF